MPEITPSRYRVDIGMRQVPHLTERDIREVLAATPPYMRDARENGTPSLGAGAVFPIPLEEISVKPFELPGWWPRAYSLDVGWNRTAALWGAWSTTDETLYVYAEHYRGQAEPATHAQAIRARGDWIPGLIDPAARGRDQITGRRLLQMYRDLGCDVQPYDASNKGEVLDDLVMALMAGRVKVFTTLTHFRAEYQVYRRDEAGKIVKADDHLMDCFDKETEVLTSNGWRFFKDLAGDEALATVNLETDMIEYQVPEALIQRLYVGEMVRIGGRKMDALVTPTHRMVVYPRGSDRPVIREAGSLGVWDKIKLNATWRGEPRGPMDVQAAYGRPTKVDPEVWAEFLGWFVSEGSIRANPSTQGGNYTVLITQSKRATREYLVRFLAKTPWRWSSSADKFETNCKWLWEQVAPLGLQVQRYVPDWVKQSEPGIIEAFLRGAVMGDGWEQRGRRNYATISRRLADDVQELFIKVGRTASVRLGRAAGQAVIGGRVHDCKSQWWASEWTSPYGLLRDSTNTPNFSRERYAGAVYCATVPNGTLIVRRNGKPMVAGNCVRGLYRSGRARATTQRERQAAPIGPTEAADSKAGY